MHLVTALSALPPIQLDTRVAALVVKLLLCTHPISPVVSQSHHVTGDDAVEPPPSLLIVARRALAFRGFMVWHARYASQKEFFSRSMP
jgi:hypothetical protein